MKSSAQRLGKIFLQKQDASQAGRPTEGGFSLIELLIATAIISLVGVVTLSVIVLFLGIISRYQDITRAQNLANEKIETLRNMPYDSLATQFGAIYPPGNIPDTETVSRGGQDYEVKTAISFVDDSFDGNALGTIPSKPTDFYPFDYKKVTVEIIGKNSQKSLVKISTDISGNAAETSDDTGILFVSVVDSNGNPVSNANIELTNTNPNPDVNITTITDTQGLLQIPLLPEDTTNGYHIEANLPGFSTDGTYPDDQPGYDPVQQDFNILAQQVTNMTLRIDRLGTLELTLENEAGAALSGVDITVRSEKLIYVDTNEINPPIAKYSQTFTSNSSGQVEISNLEWGAYSFIPEAGYYVVSVSPYQPVTLNPATSQSVTIKLSTEQTWPRISSVNPNSGLNNVADLNVEILGTNLTPGSNIELRRSGEPTIQASSESSSESDSKLTGIFNLTGAEAGVWDLVVISSGGQVTIQDSGFTISNP